MDVEQPDPWSDEVLEPRFSAAVEQHFPVLAALVTPEEAADLRPLCLEAFRYVLFDCNADDPDVVFHEAIPEAVRKAVAGGAEDLRQIIADHRVLRRLGELGSWIHGLAKQAVKGTLVLTPELREAVREKEGELDAVLADLKTKHPHLEDSRKPRPALVTSYPRMIRMRVGNVINDFRYVKDYPKGRVMSIELAHEAGYLPGTPSKGKAQESETKGDASK